MTYLDDSEMIRIDNLKKSFTLHNLNRHIKACPGVSFSVKHGQFMGIIGKSGSGKSTILKSIYRSYLPENGSIYYDSQAFGQVNISTLSERQVIYLRKYEIGYVSQFLNVLPRTTARQIVAQSVLEMGSDITAATEQADEMLNFFELDRELWDSYPVNFSGGEKLRLNVATAMIKKPRLLLLDEPTASLDVASKARVRQLIEKLKQEGTTMIGIFHDIEFMRGLCDIEFNMSSLSTQTV